MILNSETVDNLTDNDHCQNLLKILNWDGYSQWDEYQREKLYLLDNYKKFVIEKSTSGSRSGAISYFAKFCQEVL